MILKVVFRRAARAEFDGAALWYEERQAGLGLRFASKSIESSYLRCFMRDVIR